MMTDRNRDSKPLKSTMNKHPVSLTLLFSATLLAACDITEFDPAEGDVPGLDTFRSAEWDAVICTLGTASRCYAHSPSAEELWSPVVSWCDLQARVDEGELWPTKQGWYDECDSGGKPQTFAEVVCFHDLAVHITCFGGSGGWFTEVRPSCDLGKYEQEAWPATSCDPDQSPGIHDYDAVLVVPGGTPWWGRAVDGDDAFTVVPECKMPVTGASAATNPYAC
jgi:hypothetical protein